MQDKKFDETNRGAIFNNDRKEPGSNQPDRSGSINIGGVDYFIDGWLKKSQSGQTFMSLSVKRKDKQSGAPQGRAAPPAQSRPAGNRQPPPPPRDEFDDGGHYDDVPPF